MRYIVPAVIAVTAVTDKCPPPVKKFLRLVVKLIVIGFAILIFRTSIDLVNMQFSNGQVSAGLGIPMWLPYLSLPISFGFITVVQIVAFFMLLKAPADQDGPKGEGKEA